MPIVELSALSLDPAGKYRREPRRPPHLRPPGYDDEFDWFTIFYDVFHSTDANTIWFVGPPAGTLTNKIGTAILKATRAALPDIAIWNMDRCTRIQAPWKGSNIAFGAEAIPRHIAVQPNCSEWFRGKRVLLTKSKDNELHWIRDWAAFYVRNHGCNGVLLYDNGSTRYGRSDIDLALSGIRGLDIVVVVDWPYKHGPGAGTSGLWDSDFGQYGALEHARHRFLAHADACIYADIDELILTHDRSSVFERVSRSRTGFISYKGIWIENVRVEPFDAERRHAQFLYRRASHPASVEAKWAVVPARCPLGAQWRVHNVTEMKSDEVASQGVSIRHFRAINTNWRHVRWQPEQMTSDHVLDAELAEWFRGSEG